MVRKIALLGFLFSSVFFLTSAAQAQEAVPFDLAITPSVVEVAVQPGKLVTQTFQVENAGNIDLMVTPVLRDFTADGRSGLPVLQETNTFPYAELQNADIHFDQPFLLKANSQQQLILGIKPTPDAVGKDWYFSLLLKTQPSAETTLGGSGAAAHGLIAANILIRVSSTNKEPLSWKIDLQGIPQFLDSLQSLTLVPIIENTSKTLGTPQFHLTILNWQNAIVYEQDGLPDRILAKSKREIFAAVPRKEDPRSFQGEPFTFDPLFAIGPYTIRATIRNATSGPVVLEKTIVAFPFSLLLAFLSITALAGAWQAWRRKHAHRPRVN